MDTLEQIVKKGTPSEQALARLAQEHPADPRRILFRKAAYYGVGTSAMGTLFGASAYWLIAEPSSFLLSLPGAIIGGMKAIEGAEQLSLTWKAWKERHRECHLQNDGHGVFYKVDNQYTANPTPVHVILGERVYPVDNQESLQRLPCQALVYVADAQINSAQLIPYQVTINHMTDVPTSSTTHHLKGNIELGTAAGITFSWSFDKKSGDLPTGIGEITAGQRYNFLARLQDQQIATVECLYSPRTTILPLRELQEVL